MEDKELDNLLEQWAQEEIEVPFGVHEKTMLRIRQEAKLQKMKKWRSGVAVAAVCCLCVPLAITQMAVQEKNAGQEAVPMNASYEVAQATVEEAKVEEKMMVFAINDNVAETKENPADVLLASGTPLQGAGNQNAKIVVIEESTAEMTEPNDLGEVLADDAVLNENVWIERITELESDAQTLLTQLEEKVELEIQAEKTRLWSLVEEYEETLGEEYTALNLRLTAVKEQLQEMD